MASSLLASPSRSNTSEHSERFVLPLLELRQLRHGQSERIHAISKRDRTALSTPTPVAPTINVIPSSPLQQETRALQPRHSQLPLATLLHKPNSHHSVLILHMHRLTPY